MKSSRTSSGDHDRRTTSSNAFLVAVCGLTVPLSIRPAHLAYPRDGLVSFGAVAVRAVCVELDRRETRSAEDVVLHDVVSSLNSEQMGQKASDPEAGGLLCRKRDRRQVTVGLEAA